jgi:hypothetical protein
MSKLKSVLLFTLTGVMHNSLATNAAAEATGAAPTATIPATNTPESGSPAISANDTPMDSPTDSLTDSPATKANAASDTIYPLVSYKCNPEADIITLTNSLLKGEEGASYKYSDEEGTYSPWNLVEIDRRPDHTHIVRTKKIIKQCVLSSGEYTITLEPHIFSRNLDGNCGATISSAFSVSFDNYDIKERTPFEDYCRGNSPIITRVTVFGKTGEVKIKRIARYKFY